jgi:hypothetical protein
MKSWTFSPWTMKSWTSSPWRTPGKKLMDRTDKAARAVEFGTARPQGERASADKPFREK